MSEPLVIAVKARDVATELRRRGIGDDEQVTVTIDADIIPGRRESRACVSAAGLTDDDIDALIERARREAALHSQ